MQALKSYTMINFLHWMTVEHSKEYCDVQRWADLLASPEELDKITKEFEKDNPEKHFYDDQWSENLAAYSHPGNCGENHVWEDPLERYRRIPLHAIFLYTSMNEGMGSYIDLNWCALHKLSANYFDIHPVKSQFEGDEKDNEDASDFTRNSKLTKDKHSVELSKLPGIFFWDHTGETEYVSFLSDQSYNGITKSVYIIFEEIEKEPTIRAVRRAKRTLEKKETPQDLFRRLFPQTASVWSLIGVGLASLAVWAAFASAGKDDPLGRIFLVVGIALCSMFLLILVFESLSKIWVSRH